MASRRDVLGAMGAGLTIQTAAGSAPPQALDHDEVERLVELSEVSNQVLMRGDVETYYRLITLSDDFSLMSPFGGAPTHARDIRPESNARMGRFFRNGTLTQELVQAYATDDMVVLATIERSNVEVGGLPAQDWALRVTLVYQRKDGAWRLAHRHADPLAHGISLTKAAALGSGLER